MPTTAGVPRSIRTSRAIRRAGAMCAFYGWSEDKARQYGVPQRADFGAFVRKKGSGWIERHRSSHAPGLTPRSWRSRHTQKSPLHILLHAPVQRVGDEHLAARADRDVMRLAVLAERLAVAGIGHPAEHVAVADRAS